MDTYLITRPVGVIYTTPARFRCFSRKMNTTKQGRPQQIAAFASWQFQNKPRVLQDSHCDHRYGYLATGVSSFNHETAER